ncbi:MAG: hydroxysqualene dehydroxylase HpnE [Hyphomicrobium sp.]
MIQGTTHIVGAGVAGLSAAVSLVEQDRRIIIHEMTRYAGGRCRSYFDPVLGIQIDNGNHLILSSNTHTREFLNKIKSYHLLPVPEKAKFPFFDIKDMSQWTVEINKGFFPRWIFNKNMRVPETRAWDYFHLLPFLIRSYCTNKPVAQLVSFRERVFKYLVHPVLLAALNTNLEEASSQLAAKIILKTIIKGGEACKPLLSSLGLSSVFVDPAVAFLKSRGVEIQFNHQLKSIHFKNQKVCSLNFDDNEFELKREDKVILSVPPWVAKTLIPNLTTPTEYSPIVNIHYKIVPPKTLPPILAVINGYAEWIFAFPHRISVTISAADKYIDCVREELASMVWNEIKSISGLRVDLPPWQIVKEKRATFKATPAQDLLRPQAQTKLSNLFLAGDWTQTGYPATIEGAVVSGQKAAKLAL